MALTIDSIMIPLWQAAFHNHLVAPLLWLAIAPPLLFAFAPTLIIVVCVVLATVPVIRVVINRKYPAPVINWWEEIVVITGGQAYAPYKSFVAPLNDFF